MNDDIDFIEGMDLLKNPKPLNKEDKTVSISSNPWFFVNLENTCKSIYFFKGNGELLISNDGIIKRTTYEFIENSENFIITEDKVNVLYNLISVNKDFLIFKKNPANLPLVFFNNKYESINVEIAALYLNEILERYKNISKNKDKWFDFCGLKELIKQEAYQQLNLNHYEKALNKFLKISILEQKNNDSIILKIAECHAKLGQGEECLKSLITINNYNDFEILWPIAYYLYEKDKVVYSKLVLDKTFFLKDLNISFIEKYFIKTQELEADKVGVIDDLLIILILNKKILSAILILLSMDREKSIKIYKSLSSRIDLASINYFKKYYNIEKYYLVKDKATLLKNYLIDYTDNNSEYFKEISINFVKSLESLNNFDKDYKKSLISYVNQVDNEIKKVQENLFKKLSLFIQKNHLSKSKRIINILNKTFFHNSKFEKIKNDFITKRDKRIRNYILTIFSLIALFFIINHFRPSINEWQKWNKIKNSTNLNLFNSFLTNYPDGYYYSKVMDKYYENIITNYVKATDKRNLEEMLSFYNYHIVRYWNLSYPTKNDIAKIVKNIWNKTSENKNLIIKIKKLENGKYILNTIYSYKNLKNNKVYSKKSKVIFEFFNDGKIKAIYGQN